MVGQGGTSSDATATSGVRGFISKVTDRTQVVMAWQRPWPELIDRSAFEKPSSFSDVVSRVKRNGIYFRVNYIIVLLVLVALSLLWHPISVIVLAVFVLAWIYLYFGRTTPLVVFNRTITETQTIVVLGVLNVIALYLTGAYEHLTLGLFIGIVLILLHASFRNTHDLFLDQHESGISSSSAPGV
jgi:hypothetical protein